VLLNAAPSYGRYALAIGRGIPHAEIQAKTTAKNDRELAENVAFVFHRVIRASRVPKENARVL
jgi:hypothetical protein